MPGARRGLPYGASYDQRLFEEHGYFREDLRVGEDNEFNRRLQTRPKWNKRILTLHRNPTRLFPLIADQYRCGERLPALSIARPIWKIRCTRYLEAAKITATRFVAAPVVRELEAAAPVT